MTNSVLVSNFAIVIVSAVANEFTASFLLNNETGHEGSARQHFKLLKASNCRKIIIAVNKMDDRSVNWS